MIAQREAADLPIEKVGDLVTAVRRAADRWADRCAWVFDHSGEHLTFAEVEDKSNRIAAALLCAGVSRGDHVCIMLRNCPLWPLTWIAIQKIGAVMIPLNIHYRRTDAGYVIDHARASAIVTSDEFVDLLAQICAGQERDISLFSIDGSGRGKAENLSPSTAVPAEVGDNRLTGSSLLNIQYTSGTTGRPKGCMLSHYWLMHFAWRVVTAHQGLDDSDTMLTSQPFYYVDPQWNVATALLCGATLVVLDRFHPATFWDKVRQYEVTWFYCLGVMPKLLLNTPATGNDRKHALKRVICSAIPRVDHADIVARWGVPWYEAFGMTESGLDLAVDIADHDVSIGTGCIGTPMPGREARVVDEHDRPVADGETGELVLRGVGLLDGYYRDPKATAKVFLNGWLHTGDLVRRDSTGRFYYVGRTKDMIRRSGENIAAAEVESVLMNHPGVSLAACVAVPDDIRGEEIKAFIVLQRDQRATESVISGLADFCAQRLAYFKVPRYWAFRDNLPLTPSERVRKGLLRDETDPLVDSFDRIEERWRRP